VPNGPWFVLVAGSNGAGKSTFAQSPATLAAMVDDARLSELQVINPDEVTRALLAVRPSLTTDEANLEAARWTEARVRALIAKPTVSFAIETVLGSDKYKPIVELATTAGWRFLFVYVALPSVDEAVKRVRWRAAHGGHDVPEDKIRKRWHVSLANFPWFWRRSTSALLFLNPPAFAEPQLVARKPTSAPTEVLRPRADCRAALSALETLLG